MAGCKCAGRTAYLARGFSTGVFWASALPIRPRQVSRHSKVIKVREAQFLLVIVTRFSLGVSFGPIIEPGREETPLGSAEDPDPRSGPILTFTNPE